VLGFYTVESDVVLTHPRDLGAQMDQLVAIHESMHKVLTTGSLFGTFEQTVVRLRHEAVDASLPPNLETELFELSWKTHEGTASYVELCMCAMNGMDIHEHRKTFSDDYLVAMEPIVAAIGLPVDPIVEPYQWLAAVNAGKLAMNGPVLELATPERMNEHLADRLRAHAPDVRFEQLWDGIARSGGLRYLVPRFSRALEDAIVRELSHGVLPQVRWNDLSILDVRITSNRSELRHINDQTQPELMQILAEASPEMCSTIGFGANLDVVRRFLRSWSAKAPSLAKDADDVAVPDFRKDTRVWSRHYDVRVRVHGVVPRRTVRDLRAFCTSQAALGRRMFAGFLETTNGELATYAFSTTELTDADPLPWTIEPLAAWSGIVPLDEEADLVPPDDADRARLAWHVPMELMRTYRLESVLHGPVLSSVPVFDLTVMLQMTAFGLEHGFDETVCTIQMTDRYFGAIVLESRHPSGERPIFTACLATPRDAADLHVRLGLRRRPGDPPPMPVRWVEPAELEDARIVWVLLQLAYNFDVFGPRIVPQPLVSRRRSGI